MAQRITEDFVKHYQLLVEKTGNSPHNLSGALDRYDNLATSIRELDRIWRMVENHRMVAKRRFIVQAHPKFWKALKDYRARWTWSLTSLWDWQAKREGRETPTDIIERLVAELPDAPADNTGADSINDDWDFEPDTHSAASHVETVIEYLEGRIEDEPWFSRHLVHSHGSLARSGSISSKSKRNSSNLLCLLFQNKSRISTVLKIHGACSRISPMYEFAM